MTSIEKLPAVWDLSRPWADRQREIIDILCGEEYGFLPPAPDDLTWEIAEENKKFCAGKVNFKKILLTSTIFGKKFTFPFYASVPNKSGLHPFFIHINFRADVPDKYLPIEEICDGGFAVFSFCYGDVTADDGDFSNGLAGTLFGENPRRADDCGKIGMWAWAASRVMDYAQTLDNLNFAKSAVAGHSRLGKTALLTGMLDKRFEYAFSNNSGCSGAALSRGKCGETIRDIYERFPYWFCENYKKYVDKEHELPFDQHFLLAAIAPRKVYVASAEEDLWADPASEFAACVAASEVYEKLGMKGFVCSKSLPTAGDKFAVGDIGYHLRAGTHYFSREDWQCFMEFLGR